MLTVMDILRIGGIRIEPSILYDFDEWFEYIRLKYSAAKWFDGTASAPADSGAVQKTGWLFSGSRTYYFEQDQRKDKIDDTAKQGDGAGLPALDDVG